MSYTVMRSHLYKVAFPVTWCHGLTFFLKTENASLSETLSVIAISLDFAVSTVPLLMLDFYRKVPEKAD